MSDHQNASAVLDRPQAGELRRVPLSSIELRDGHNPRDEVMRDDSFTSLVATVRQHGILQPLRVTEPEPGRFELVAGERRYWAAIEVACIDVPVIVRAASESQSSDLDRRNHPSLSLEWCCFTKLPSSTPPADSICVTSPRTPATRNR